MAKIYPALRAGNLVVSIGLPLYSTSQIAENPRRFAQSCYFHRSSFVFLASKEPGISPVLPAGNLVIL